eukprot:TRINITY_DN0_c410_g1_i1.p1 TRINITY_DN0_c410_g1~~TRINITY_DN0_c410_g1_i1.p1  ORF type:complete len:158 (-),score=47.10 TRINITY_DN0_c410_g1_i1:103-576(-)
MFIQQAFPTFQVPVVPVQPRSAFPQDQYPMMNTDTLKYWDEENMTLYEGVFVGKPVAQVPPSGVSTRGQNQLAKYSSPAKYGGLNSYSIGMGDTGIFSAQGSLLGPRSNFGSPILPSALPLGGVLPGLQYGQSIIGGVSAVPIVPIVGLPGQGSIIL